MKKIHILLIVIATCLISIIITYCVIASEDDYLIDYDNSAYIDPNTKQYTDEIVYQSIDYMRLSIYDLNKRCVIEKTHTSRCKEEFELINSLYIRLFEVVNTDEMKTLGNRLSELYLKL